MDLRSSLRGFRGYASCTINALALANPDGTPGQIVLQNPLPGYRGNLGQNAMRGPGAWNLDANMSKTFRISESKSFQVRIDTTNVLNHPNPYGCANNGCPVVTDINNANFGNIAIKNSNTRSFQGTLRLQF